MKQCQNCNRDCRTAWPTCQDIARAQAAANEAYAQAATPEEAYDAYRAAFTATIEHPPECGCILDQICSVCKEASC